MWSMLRQGGQGCQCDRAWSPRCRAFFKSCQAWHIRIELYAWRGVFTSKSVRLVRLEGVCDVLGC